MDFELSPDQRDLRDAAVQVLDRHASSGRVRAVIGPADGTGPGEGVDRELWAVIAEQGWLAVEAPESEGGLGLGMVEVGVLAEQLGRHVAPVPFAESSLAQGALRVASSDERVTDTVRRASAMWLGALASGEAIGCVAWSPASVLAEEAPDGTCRLTVDPEPAAFASVAEVAVVATPDAVFAVELRAEDRPHAQPSLDRTRPLGWLELERAPAFRLGGADAAAGLLDRAATACAAGLLGSASRVLEMSVAYAKDRHQFGKPIGSFQAVKHRLADALVDVEAMRSAAYHAAWSIAEADAVASAGADGGTSPTPASSVTSLAASSAKAWCSDAAARVMAAGLQVHGGIGFTWEHDLHLFVKRSRLDQTSWGDATYHRERVASFLSEWGPTDPSLF